MLRVAKLPSVLLLGIIILCAAASIEAAKKRKKKSGNRGGSSAAKKVVIARYSAFIKSVESQLPRAKNEAARAKLMLQSANEQVRINGQRLYDATQNLDRALENHEAIEESVVESLPPDGPFWTAWERYEAAREGLQAASRAALSTPAYERALAEVKRSPDPGPGFAELRAETLYADLDVAKWRAELEIAKRDFEETRRKKLDGNVQWLQSASQVRGARAEVKLAKEWLDKILSHRGETLTDAKRAVNVANRGQAAVQAAKANKNAISKSGGSGKKGSGRKKSGSKGSKSSKKK